MTYDSKYIDRDDYLEEKGIDLSIELQDDDNNSNKVERFIKEVTDWCCVKLAFDYCCNELNPNLPNQYNSFKDFRKRAFRMGVIEQIQYILDNGLISKNSGINSVSGYVIDYSKLELGSDALKWFRSGAFCNIEHY